MLGVALAELYPMSPQHRGVLLNSLETRRKFLNIKDEMSKTQVSDGVLNAFREMNYCFETLKIERDVIAHGTILFGQDGKGSFTSTKNFYELPLSRMTEALDNAQYCLEVCRFITQTVIGQTPEPLRERPKAAHLR